MLFIHGDILDVTLVPGTNACLCWEEGAGGFSRRLTRQYLDESIASSCQHCVRGSWIPERGASHCEREHIEGCEMPPTPFVNVVLDVVVVAMIPGPP